MHWMASSAIASACSKFSPHVTTPGNEGTVTVNPPSGSGCRVIRYVEFFMFCSTTTFTL